MPWLCIRYGHEKLRFAFVVAPIILVAISYISINVSNTFVDLTAPASIAFLYFSLANFYSAQIRSRWAGDEWFAPQLDASSPQWLGCLAVTLPVRRARRGLRGALPQSAADDRTARAHDARHRRAERLAGQGVHRHRRRDVDRKLRRRHSDRPGTRTSVAARRRDAIAAQGRRRRCNTSFSSRRWRRSTVRVGCDSGVCHRRCPHAGAARRRTPARRACADKPHVDDDDRAGESMKTRSCIRWRRQDARRRSLRCTRSDAFAADVVVTRRSELRVGPLYRCGGHSHARRGRACRHGQDGGRLGAGAGSNAAGAAAVTGWLRATGLGGQGAARSSLALLESGRSGGGNVVVAAGIRRIPKASRLALIIGVESSGDAAGPVRALARRRGRHRIGAADGVALRHTRRQCRGGGRQGRYSRRYRRRLGRLARRTQPGDQVFIYFSGPGMLTRSGAGDKCNASWVSADGRSLSAQSWHHS